MLSHLIQSYDDSSLLCRIIYGHTIAPNGSRGYPLFRKKIREAGNFFFRNGEIPLVVCWLTVGKASINKGADAPRTVAMRADRREACIATVL